MNPFWYYAAMAASVIIASTSQILLKKSALKKYDSFLKEYMNPYVIIGYGMMFLSMFLTIFVYSGMAYKNVPIVESLGYVLVMILCSLFFREKITKRKIWGTALILLGVAVYYLQTQQCKKRIPSLGILFSPFTALIPAIIVVPVRHELHPEAFYTIYYT